MPRLSRVSFDFDDTLTDSEVSIYAESLIERGFDVWIITARQKKDFEPVFSKAKDLGISKEHVIFTDLEYKTKTVDEVDPIFHVDDSFIEIKLIGIRNKGTKAIMYGYDPDWRDKCEDALIPYKDKDGFALTPSVQKRKT
jgi:hypothetical protein